MFSFLVGLLAIYLALGAFLYVFQRSLIYFPYPASADLGPASLTLESGGERLRVSHTPHDGPRAVVYFGGNAEDVSYSLSDLAEAFPDHALYLLHYRGYGGSSGSPSETALFADGLALFDYVHARHAKIIVIGGSLGSGVAVYVASRRPAAGLVLIAPFDRIADVAASNPVFAPFTWLLRDRFDSWRYAPQVTARTLILMAEHDEMIPRASTERLLSRFTTGLARLRMVSGATHNSIYESPEYIPLLKQAAPLGY